MKMKIDSKDPYRILDRHPVVGCELVRFGRVLFVVIGLFFRS